MIFVFIPLGIALFVMLCVLIVTGIREGHFLPVKEESEIAGCSQACEISEV